MDLRYALTNPLVIIFISMLFGLIWAFNLDGIHLIWPEQYPKSYTALDLLFTSAFGVSLGIAMVIKPKKQKVGSV